MFRKMMLALIGLVMGAMALPAQAQTYVAGQHYVQIDPPARTADPTKIEVVLVFAFSCPQCLSFEPSLQAWARKQPTDVNLRRVHAMWNPAMEPLARGFYTAQTLKIGDATLMPIFNALHMEHRSLNTAQEWADFFSGHGVDKAKALSTFNSFGVTSQIKQAEALVRSFKAAGAPELVIGGKYRISPRQAGSLEQMLKVADFLVAKERQARAGG